MRLIFMGLFILSLLAGLITIGMNMEQKSGGFIQAFLNTVGLARQEQQQKSHTQEVAETLWDQRRAFMEDLHDQQAFLKQAKDQSMDLSSMVREMADKSKVDMLRLQDMMRDFEAHNRLLVERGNELIKFNQEQLKIRQQTMDDANMESLDSQLSHSRFVQYARETSLQRANFINQSLINVSELRERTDKLNDKLRSLENNLTTKEDAQLITKLKDMKDKSKEVLFNVRNNEQRLRDRQQERSINISIAKEKLNEFIDNNARQTSDALQRMEDQKASNNDRMRDQLEQLKSQRGQ